MLIVPNGMEVFVLNAALEQLLIQMDFAKLSIPNVKNMIK